MHEALSVLADLSGDHLDRLLSSAEERGLQREDLLISESTVPDHLYIVLEGLLEARHEASGGCRIALLGPGELLGEVSWLEGGQASLTVKAVEDGLVLAFSRETLEVLVAQDPALGVALYRAFGRSLARRLRLRTHEFSERASNLAPVPTAEHSAWGRIVSVLDGLKELMLEAEKATQRNHGTPPDEFVTATEAGLDQLCRVLHQEFGPEAPLDQVSREEFGRRVRLELHPFLMLTRIVERIYSKPRGYAGDFLTIEWMYEDDPGGTGAAGPLIDRAFLSRPAARAVRNRRGLLADEIRGAVDRGGQVLSLACGPARELFDVFEELPDAHALKATCLDIDLNALALVSDRRDRMGLRRQMDLQQGNLVYLATGRSKLELPLQDLIYSIGLIDYFQDRFVVSLLDWIHDRLKPGGKVVLGNFHTANPDKELMDIVLDWKLIHRDEADMHRLFEASRFGKPCSEIQYEEAGVNLFAIGERS